jgi:hypothetical protein
VRSDNAVFAAQQNIHEFMAALVNQRQECEAQMIRVSPGDNCQIEQSLDGGETWQNLFRLDECQIVPQVFVDAAQKTVGGQTVDGFFVQFDMDGDAVIDASFTVYDGFNGADGAAGADGADGADAPTPEVFVDAAEKTVGGQTVDGFFVQFDMDGDAVIDASFTVYDGFNGADGADAPTPEVFIDAAQKTQNGVTVDGVLVQFDMDGDATIDGQFAVYDGFPGQSVITSIPDFEPPSGESNACNVATYMTDIVLPALYDEIVLARQNNATAINFTAAVLGITALFTGGLAIPLTAGVAALTGVWLGYSDTQMAAAADAQFWEDVKCAMKKALEIDGNTGQLSEYTMSFTSYIANGNQLNPPTIAHDVLFGILLYIEQSDLDKLTNIGLLYAGDCAICPAPSTVDTYDFTTSDYSVTWFIRDTSAVYVSSTGYRENWGFSGQIYMAIPQGTVIHKITLNVDSPNDDLNQVEIKNSQFSPFIEGGGSILLEDFSPLTASQYVYEPGTPYEFTGTNRCLHIKVGDASDLAVIQSVIVEYE